MPARLLLRRRFLVGEDQKDQSQHEGQMHAAVRRFAQQTKTGGVVVKAGQRNQQVTVVAAMFAIGRNRISLSYFASSSATALSSMRSLRSSAGCAHGFPRLRQTLKICRRYQS